MATSSGHAPPRASGHGAESLQPSRLAEDDQGGIQLQDLLKVLRRRRRTFLAVLVAVALTGTGVAVARRLLSPVFEGSFSLLISDPVNEAGAAGSDEGGAISSVARNVSRVDVPTLIRVLQSPAVLEPVYSELGRRYPGRRLPAVAVSLVSADRGQGRDIIAPGVLLVSARGGDPDLVLETLRLSEEAALAWSLRQRREKLSEGVRFLDDQAPLLRARSAELQQELERFRLSNNVLLPAEEAQAVREQVESLRTRLREQQQERARLVRVRADVEQGKLTARGFSSTAGSTAPADATVTQEGVTVDVPDQSELAELTRLEGEIAAARATYRAGSPMLETLLASRDRLRPELQRKQLEALDAALQLLDDGIASSRQQIAQLESRFSSQPAQLRQFEELQARLEIANENLANYNRTREQFQLEIAQSNLPWKVIAPALVNPQPVEPQLSRGVLLGLLFGLLAGTGAAVLHDRLDHVFHASAEVRDELKTPLLGHIPYISFFAGVRSDRRFVLEELDDAAGGMASYQRFSYQEAFRNLYTSLRFLNSDRQVRSVVLSSSVPGEGKSLVIVLLAKTLTELGQRVLLVDADLRKPQLHHRLGLNNLEGLTNLLTQEQRSWREVVQPVPGHAHWDVITAGRRPPDPPRLLSSARFAELVKDIAENGGYDLVLYDTPPALGLADAALVAEPLDGIVLLVSLNRVDRRLPQEALQRIQAAGAPVLGVVTNARSARVDDASILYGGERYGQAYDNNPYNPALAYSYYQLNDQKPAGSLPGRWLPGLRRWLNG